MKIKKLIRSLGWGVATAVSFTQVPVYAAPHQASPAVTESQPDPSREEDLNQTVAAIKVSEASYAQEFKAFVRQYLRKRSFQNLDQLTKKDRNKIALLFKAAHEEIESIDFLFSTTQGYYVNITQGVLISNIIVTLPKVTGLWTAITDGGRVKEILEKPFLIKEKSYLSAERLKKILPFLETAIRNGLEETGESLRVEAAIKYHQDDQVNKLYVTVHLGPEMQLTRDRLVITGLSPELATKLKFYFIPRDSLGALGKNPQRIYSTSQKNQLLEKRRVLQFFIDRDYLEAKINTFTYANGLLYIDICPGPKFTRTYQIVEVADSQSKPLTPNETRALESQLHKFAKTQAFTADNNLASSLDQSIQTLKQEISEQIKKDDRCFFSIEEVAIVNSSEEKHNVFLYVNPGLFKCRVGQVQIVGSHRVDLFHHLLPFRNKSQTYFSQETLDRSIEKINELPHIKFCTALPAYKKGKVNITYVVIDVMERTSIQANWGLRKQGATVGLYISDKHLVRTGIPVAGAISLSLALNKVFAKAAKKSQDFELVQELVNNLNLSIKLETSLSVFSKKYLLDVEAELQPQLGEGPALAKLKLTQNLLYGNFAGVRLSGAKQESPDLSSDLAAPIFFFIGNKSGKFTPTYGIPTGLTRSVTLEADKGFNALLIQGRSTLALPAPLERDFLVARLQGDVSWALPRDDNQLQQTSTYLSYKGSHLNADTQDIYRFKHLADPSANYQSLIPGAQFYAKAKQEWQTLYTVRPVATLSLSYKLALPFFFRGITARNFSPKHNLSVIGQVGGDCYLMNNKEIAREARQNKEMIKMISEMKENTSITVVHHHWQAYLMLYLRIPFTIPIIGSAAVKLGIVQGLARGITSLIGTGSVDDPNLAFKSTWLLLKFTLQTEEI